MPAPGGLLCCSALLAALSPASAVSSEGRGEDAFPTTTPTVTTPTATTGPPRCSWACLHHKQIELDRIQSLKAYILDKLGMPEPPKIPPHLKDNQFAIDVLLDRAVTGYDHQPSPPPPPSWSAGGRVQADQPTRSFLEQALLTRARGDDDDDVVKPRKVIAFAETGAGRNDSKQCPRYEGKEVHMFRFSKEVMSYEVASARLWLYVQAPGHQHHHNHDNATGPAAAGRGAGGGAGGRGSSRGRPRHRGAGGGPVTLAVVWVRRRAAGKLQAAFRASLKADLGAAGGGRWLHVDLTAVVAEWFRRGDGDLGLVLSAADADGRQVHVFSGDEDSEARTPFIELTPSSAPHPTRSRRSLGIECDGRTEEKRCCRYPLTIDFGYLEWDWIIAPKTYEANYCAGDCLYAFLPKYPHSYIIQVTNRTICCAPRKMSSISMVYFNREHHIVYSTLPGMTVEMCGCS